METFRSGRSIEPSVEAFNCRRSVDNPDAPCARADLLDRVVELQRMGIVFRSQCPGCTAPNITGKSACRFSGHIQIYG